MEKSPRWAYELAAMIQRRGRWPIVAETLGYSRAETAHRAAVYHAHRHGRPWPPGGDGPPPATVKRIKPYPPPAPPAPVKPPPLSPRLPGWYGLLNPYPMTNSEIRDLCGVGEE